MQDTEKTGIQEIEFNSVSGNITAVTYDYDNGVMEITFDHGGSYRYDVPPQVAEGFEDSISAGKYFNSVIKNTYSGY